MPPNHEHGRSRQAAPSLAEVFDVLRRYCDGHCPSFYRNLHFGYEQNDGQRTRIAVPPPGGPAADPPAPRAATHSPDFRTVNWYGAVHRFTATQARVVQALWEARDHDAPEMGQAALLEAADSVGSRLANLFRGHAAWGVVIVPGELAGTYRLGFPPWETPEPTRED